MGRPRPSRTRAKRRGRLSKRRHNLERTLRRRQRVSPLAIDCEFVQTVDDDGSRTMSLAQCAIVDFHGNLVFNSFINPKHRVDRKSLDHPKRVTDFKLHHLQHGMPEDEACRRIQDLLKGHTLVLHTPHSDLEKIHLFDHPAHLIRDVAMYLPLREPLGESKGTEHDAVIEKVKGHNHSQPVGLSKLYFCRFGSKIQTNYHTAEEDARATMQLYKSINVVWEHDVRHGRYRYAYPRSWVRKYGNGSLPKDDADTSDGEEKPDSEPIVLASGFKARVPV